MIDLSETKTIWIYERPYIIPKDLTYKEEEYLYASQMTLMLGNKSVDRFLKEYDEDFKESFAEREETPKQILLKEILETSKKQQNQLSIKFKEISFTDNETVSSFACATVITRLSATFQAVHSLIHLGYYFESFALIRMIMEQLAYAYTASDLKDDLSNILSPTKSITRLAEFYPKTGKLYGILSKKAHIDQSQVGKYIKVKNGKMYTQLYSIDYSLELCTALLIILDLQYVVFEYSFRKYLKSFDCIAKFDNNYRLIDDRKNKNLFSWYAKKVNDLLKIVS